MEHGDNLSPRITYAAEDEQDQKHRQKKQTCRHSYYTGRTLVTTDGPQ